VASPAQGTPEDPLGFPLVVYIGGVEEVNPGIQTAIHHPDGFSLGSLPPNVMVPIASRETLRLVFPRFLYGITGIPDSCAE
jgi:hypothetical protein